MRLSETPRATESALRSQLLSSRRRKRSRRTVVHHRVQLQNRPRRLIDPAAGPFARGRLPVIHLPQQIAGYEASREIPGWG